MSARWSVTQEMSTVGNTQIFSGGACNILNAEGDLLRNTERDAINDWITAKDITFYDPQIHPDTHKMEYDYTVHHPLEVAARRAAQLNLYEISPRTFGGITSLEIANDYFKNDEPMVLYFSDGDADTDDIPDYSKHGYPIFKPYGIRTQFAAKKAHYQEMVKNANNMRRYLTFFAQDIPELSISFGERISDTDIVITPRRMHAADIFEAVVKASRGERVYVCFEGDESQRDDEGVPIFVIPNNPSMTQHSTLLDQYVDEGNELRKRIAELIGINVFVRVVYTQRSAILALEELMMMRGLLPKDPVTSVADDA